MRESSYDIAATIACICILILALLGHYACSPDLEISTHTAVAIVIDKAYRPHHRTARYVYHLQSPEIGDQIFYNDESVQGIPTFDIIKIGDKVSIEYSERYTTKIEDNKIIRTDKEIRIISLKKFAS